MNTREFIFSNKHNTRIKRHIAFWFVFYIILVLSFPPAGSFGSVNGLYADGFFQYYKMAFIRLFFYLLFNMAFFYTLTYFLMPFFWKQQYIKFIGLFFMLILAVSVLRYAGLMFVYNPIMKQLNLHVNSEQDILRASIILNYEGPVFWLVPFFAFKFFKDWQQKQQDNFNLIKENTNAELQLLKAQVHPHFLFNTLNNIYSFTLNKSLYAKNLVKKLEGILRYMIEDCSQPFVPLAKEIKMIEDYIELEKVRYGNRLDISVNIEGEDQNKMVTPLLMIPFVENSFKHGTSKMLTNPWIKLNIEAREDILHFSVINSKPKAFVNSNGKTGIGLSNVKKRLALLYPQNHLLKIELAETTFLVNMQIPLEKVAEEIAIASL